MLFFSAAFILCTLGFSQLQHEHFPSSCHHTWMTTWKEVLLANQDVQSTRNVGKMVKTVTMFQLPAKKYTVNIPHTKTEDFKDDLKWGYFSKVTV